MSVDSIAVRRGVQEKHVLKQWGWKMNDKKKKKMLICSKGDKSTFTSTLQYMARHKSTTAMWVLHILKINFIISFFDYIYIIYQKNKESLCQANIYTRHTYNLGSTMEMCLQLFDMYVTLKALNTAFQFSFYLFIYFWLFFYVIKLRLRLILILIKIN